MPIATKANVFTNEVLVDGIPFKVDINKATASEMAARLIVVEYTFLAMYAANVKS